MPTSIGPETVARIAAVWPDILASVGAGELVRDAIGRHKVSREQLAAYLMRTPQARIEWETARELSADAFMDEALTVARDPRELLPQPPKEDGSASDPILVPIEPAHARTRIDTLKWAARIRNPRLYGEKQQIDMNVRTVDLTRVIADARKRLEASRVIEGAVIRPAIANKPEPHITSESVPALSDLL